MLPPHASSKDTHPEAPIAEAAKPTKDEASGAEAQRGGVAPQDASFEAA